MSTVWRCTAADWSLKIGDPTMLGWLTVAGYALAALLSIRLTLSPSRRVKGDFWLSLSVVLLCLCINKQLELQTGARTFLTCHGQVFGWYEYRLALQLIFLGVVASLLLILAISVAWSLRRRFKSHWQAIVGVGFVLGVLATQAASFAYLDRLLNVKIGFLKLTNVLELAGISLVIWNAAVLLHKIKTQKRTQHNNSWHR